ncbi:hypothetical protein RSJ21_09295 [Clostridium botulinum]|uniref:hypothetical protein n=1 Tax=Clostridium botulinum TaxID=1491 RepID=UPI0004B870F8|nr:hypothetical protein [Clostridium botulinum]AUN06633.1 hypothetical protein RSJ14_07905 [Clostridium botulinum]AUN25435.1 hypothetical protein RSJ21_09295 [Clostridium botulinum]MBN3352730.1 hypothetical protein [Clostridium botulinum]MBN3360558.1 hypothetical protein [Clostridium botulinum]MBN3365638.1 hypothetical protein [Clostridium botulinum]
MNIIKVLNKDNTLKKYKAYLNGEYKGIYQLNTDGVLADKNLKGIEDRFYLWDIIHNFKFEEI